MCLHSAFVGPSLERCTLACSYCLGAQQSFVDSLPAAVVATCIVVLASVVARPLASDTDPFDVLAASFAWSLRQNRRHQTMVRGMSERWQFKRIFISSMCVGCVVSVVVVVWYVPAPICAAPYTHYSKSALGPQATMNPTTITTAKNDNL